MSDAVKLAGKLRLSVNAIREAQERGLLTFTKHRDLPCWRFGDDRNGCFRRLDCEPFIIGKTIVKAASECSGEAWHRLIGLDDIVRNDRRDVLLIGEGSKDALAALHFANAEASLQTVGLAVALGVGLRLLPEDINRLQGRRIRIIGDDDAEGQSSCNRIGRAMVHVAREVQILRLCGLRRADGEPVKDLFDLTQVDYDDFERNRDLRGITDLSTRGDRILLVTQDDTTKTQGRPKKTYSRGGKEFESDLFITAASLASVNRGESRSNLFKLVRAILAFENKGGSNIRNELFDVWYEKSRGNLDPAKTSAEYRADYLRKFHKVRVVPGQNDTLNSAIKAALLEAPPEIPGATDAPPDWRLVAAVCRELQRTAGVAPFFLSARSAAKIVGAIYPMIGQRILDAFVDFGVLKRHRIGDARPGGKASEFKYLLPM